MSKKRGTTETRLKPGSPANLWIAAFGDQSGAEFDRMRCLVFGWLNSEAADELARKDQPSAAKITETRRLLIEATLILVTTAIIHNRPEDLRKLAAVLERAHETKKVDQSGNVSFPAVSEDLYRVIIHHVLTLRENPGHVFTLKEWRKVVGCLSDEQAEEANEALDKRIRRMLDKVGIARSGQ